MPDPTTPIRENFNDTEGPPMTGWTDLNAGVRSNGTTGQANAANSFSYLSSAGQFPNANCEAYQTITTKAGAAQVVSVTLLDVVSSLAALDGYEGRATSVTGAANDTWRIYRADNGVVTQIATATVEIVNGDGIWLTTQAGNFTLYRRSSGVWASLTTATDTTYSGAKWLGISMSDTTARVDDFGGGAIRGQIMTPNRGVW